MDPRSRTTQATYDVVAPEYAERNSRLFDHLEQDAQEFAALIAGRGPVLDVGCGTGRDLRLLGSLGVAVIGVDLSWGMLAQAGSAPLVQDDMHALPVRTGAVPGIWCKAAFLHIPRESAPLILREFVRVLQRRGVLHLSVSEGQGQGWESGAYDSSLERWFCHYQWPELESMLADAGFRVLGFERDAARRRWLRVLAQSP